MLGRLRLWMLLYAAAAVLASACISQPSEVSNEVASNVPEKKPEAEKKAVKAAKPKLPAPIYFRWSEKTSMYGVSLQSELYGATDVMMLSIGLTSKMLVLPVSRLSSEDLVKLSLVGPTVRIEGDSKPTDAQLTLLTAEIMQPVWGRFVNGRLVKMYFPEKPSAYAVGIWRTLLTGLQASMPINLDETFKTSEFDGNGEARITYTKSGADKWQKTKVSYAKGLHTAESESPIGGAPTPKLIASAGEVTLAANKLKSVRLDERIDVPLSGPGGLTGHTFLTIDAEDGNGRIGTVQLPPRNALVLAADEPFVQTLPMDAMDKERMKGLTFDDTLRALVARSRDPRKKALWAAKNDKPSDAKDKKDAEAWTEDWARYFAALPAFFRQMPETLKRAEKEIRDGNPAVASLLGGLASSGNPAAQDVLIRLTLDDKLDMELRESAARNLVQCTNPSKKTADTVWKLAEGSDFTRLAVFGIGIIARKMRKNGEIDEAAKLLQKLIDRLGKTEDPHEKRDVLRGISNTGDPAALDAVKPLFQSDNATVRGGAVEAVRLMEIPEADALIAERISYKTETADGVRASAIRAAATRSHEDPILAALLETAEFDPDRKVKKEARRLLFSWANGNPDLTAKLEAIADADERDTAE